MANTQMKIKKFTEALGEHPGRVLFEQYISAYKDLCDIDKAQHKIAQTDTYKNYCLAQQYGIQIYNYTQGNT
jgi:hypothetical protein